MWFLEMILTSILSTKKSYKKLSKTNLMNNRKGSVWLQFFILRIYAKIILKSGWRKTLCVKNAKIYQLRQSKFVQLVKAFIAIPAHLISKSVQRKNASLENSKPNLLGELSRKLWINLLFNIQIMMDNLDATKNSHIQNILNIWLNPAQTTKN